MLRNLFLAFAVTLVPALSMGQQPSANEVSKSIVTPDLTTTCQSTFTSGSGATLFKFCVTANGNITKLESPAGFEHLQVGGFAEGYGFCDVNSNQSYYDFAVSDSGNWLAATITQPGGPNTLPLTIKRTTADGLFTLTQAFSRNTGERIIKINTTLKNNVPVSKPVFLVRWADVDADNDFPDDYADHGLDASWDYEPAGHGVMLYVATPTVTHFANVLLGSAFVNPCTLAGASTPAFGDGAIYAGYNLTMGASGSKTVAFEYKRF